MTVYNGSEIIFTMGIPAAGKSTWVEKNLPHHRIIDADVFKGKYPLNSTHPDRIHEWSKAVADMVFSRALKQSGSWVFLGSGTNIAKMSVRMRQARANGFRVVVAYFECSVQTALERNAMRTRHVPEYVIVRKSHLLIPSLDALSRLADHIFVVNTEPTLPHMNTPHVIVAGYWENEGNLPVFETR